MFSRKRPNFYAVSLVLQLEFAVAALAADCMNRLFLGHPDCNENCWKPSRIEGGHAFPCKVVNNIELRDFQNRYKTEQATAKHSNLSVCKPPLMTKISLYALPYNNRKHAFTPAFKVNFDISFIGQPYKPEIKAVLLRFDSPEFKDRSEQKYTDNIFNVKNPDGPRYRLFDFSTYKVSSYDVDNTISVDYSCIYGLDDCSTEKVYSITLTSLAMNMSRYNQNFFQCKTETCAKCSLTYTISVNPARYNEWNRDPRKYPNREYENWSMTIATALYPSHTDIYILWEQDNTTMPYEIKLVENSSIVREKTTNETHFMFTNVPAGIYKVQIICHSGNESSKTYTTLHSIEITLNTDTEFRGPNLDLFIGSISGCILGIFMICVIAFLRCRKPKNLEGTSIEHTKYIILSNKDKASELVSQALGCAFENLNIVNVERTNNFKIEHPLNNSVLLILIPAQHEQFKFKLRNDSPYKQFIDSLAKRTKTWTNFRRVKVYLIYFPFMRGAQRVPWSCLHSFKRISLMEEFNKMLKLLKIKSTDEQRLNIIKSDLHSAVKRAENILKNYHPHNQTTVTFRDFPEEDHKDSVCPVHGTQFENFHPRFVRQESSGMLGTQQYRLLAHETIPLIDRSSIIPPSPIPNNKGSTRPSEPLRMDSDGSSGYGTSRQNSSASDNNPCLKEVENPDSLADDETLYNEMMRINFDHFTGHPKGSDNAVDPMIAINFGY